MEKELDEFEKTASTDSFASELPVVLYATKYFHFLTDTTKKDGIKYEIEYLIAVERFGKRESWNGFLEDDRT